MADSVSGKKMSEYPSVDVLPSEQKSTYLGNASIVAVGEKTPGGDKENYRVPLSEIGGGGGGSLPDPPSKNDQVLTYDLGSSTSKWADPTLDLNLAKLEELQTVAPLRGGGTGSQFNYITLGYDSTLRLVEDQPRDRLGVKNPVPDPGTDLHRGDVLTVNDSDEIVWGAGGGGGGSIVIAKVVLQDADDEEYSLNFISGTHTVKQLYNLINDGTAIVNVQLTILNVDGYAQEVHLLTAGATRNGESHNVYMVGAGGSGSYTSSETAELLGWWDEGEEAGQWHYLNTTQILYPEG